MSTIIPANLDRIDWNSNEGWDLEGEGTMAAVIQWDRTAVREAGYSIGWQEQHRDGEFVIIRLKPYDEAATGWRWSTLGGVSAAPLWPEAWPLPTNMVPWPLKTERIPDAYNMPVWWTADLTALRGMSITPYAGLENGDTVLMWFYQGSLTEPMDRWRFTFDQDPNQRVWYWTHPTHWSPPMGNDYPLGRSSGTPSALAERYLMLGDIEYKVSLPPGKFLAGEALRILLDTDLDGACYGGRIGFLRDLMANAWERGVGVAGSSVQLFDAILTYAYSGTDERRRYAVSVIRQMGGRINRSNRPVFATGQMVRVTATGQRGQVLAVGTDPVAARHVVLPGGLWTPDAVGVVIDGQLNRFTREQLAHV